MTIGSISARPAVPSAPSSSSQVFVPPPVTRLEDTGLAQLWLQDLALKILYFQGYLSGFKIAEEIALPFAGVTDQILESLKREKLVEVKSSSMGLGEGSYQYAITGAGIEHAREALERSPLRPDDLNQIPFTLLVPNCPVTFMEHKRCVVHIARDAAKAMDSFMGRPLPINPDVVIAGAILADVGKLLEYEIGTDGKNRQSERGEALRHPFTGVALALECGVPDEVCHIIAAHAAEGDLVKRTTEAFIVHHADFMAFLPFKNAKNIRVTGQR